MRTEKIATPIALFHALAIAGALTTSCSCITEPDIIASVLGCNIDTIKTLLILKTHSDTLIQCILKLNTIAIESDTHTAYALPKILPNLTHPVNPQSLIDDTASLSIDVKNTLSWDHGADTNILTKTPSKELPTHEYNKINFPLHIDSASSSHTSRASSTATDYMAHHNQIRFITNEGTSHDFPRAGESQAKIERT